MTLVAGIAAALIGILIGDIDFVPSWPSTGWLVLLAASSQVLAWLLVAHALPRLSAVAISLLLMIQPVCSVFFAALILGERPSGLQLFGSLILVGILGVVLLPGRAEVAEDTGDPLSSVFGFRFAILRNSFARILGAPGRLRHCGPMLKKKRSPHAFDSALLGGVVVAIAGVGTKLAVELRPARGRR